MNQDAYRRHLRARTLELWTLPLRSIHADTGLPVYLLMCIVIDAFDRVEMGRLG